MSPPPFRSARTPGLLLCTSSAPFSTRGCSFISSMRIESVVGTADRIERSLFPVRRIDAEAEAERDCIVSASAPSPSSPRRLDRAGGVFPSVAVGTAYRIQPDVFPNCRIDAEADAERDGIVSASAPSSSSSRTLDRAGGLFPSVAIVSPDRIQPDVFPICRIDAQVIRLMTDHR